MKKLFSSGLAAAVNTAFVATVVLSGCAGPEQKSGQQTLSSEERARLRAEKQQADEKQARDAKSRQPPSSTCGQR